jgi:hypothetical protein
MAEPSWRQLSMVPESVLKASIIKALGFEDVPAAGVNRQFDGGTFQVYATVAPTMHLPDGIRYTLYQDGGTKSFDTPKEVLRVVKAAPGTATGDALRNFFHYYFLKP